MTEVTEARRDNLLLVHNPRAGRTGGALIAGVRAALSARGVRVEARSLAGIGDNGNVLADASRFDAVVAAGGDGTLRAVLNALGDSATPVGLVPVGTGNVFAHETGLPRDAAGLADVLISGPAVRVTGGRVNGEPFYLMAGAGFDGNVIRRLNPGLKLRIGKAAYTWPILRSLGDAAHDLEVVVDGVQHTASWVVVARVRHYGGGFMLAPGASLLRPGFVAVLFEGARRSTRIRQLAALATGKISSAPGVRQLRCTRVQIGADYALAVEVDGDVSGVTPLVVDANGPVVSLVVPAHYARSARADVAVGVAAGI